LRLPTERCPIASFMEGDDLLPKSQGRISLKFVNY